jgi:glucokinase
VTISDDAPVIGIDAGGTEIKAGLLSGAKILEKRRYFTERENGPEHAVAQVLLAAKEMRDDYPEAKAIGLVVPGIVDAVSGIAEFSENIGWRNVEFKNILENAIGLPVGFGHDVRAGGKAEAIYGSGIGYKNSFYISIGTGISGAMVIDGVLNENPYSGEIGHFDVNTGISCPCGSSGCLETIATAPSIVRNYNENSLTSLSNAREVLDLVKMGDPIALEAWSRAVDAVAISLAAYVTILAPEVIIFGGGVSRAGDFLLNPIREHFDKKLIMQKAPILVMAKFGDEAGMIGAGLLGSDALIKSDQE